MDWYKIVFVREQIADEGAIFNLRHRFHELWSNQGCPRGLTLYITRTGCEDDGFVTFYLPPSAPEYCPQLLDEYFAIPCPRPERSILEGVIGIVSDYDIWFPEDETSDE